MATSTVVSATVYPPLQSTRCELLQEPQASMVKEVNFRGGCALRHGWRIAGPISWPDDGRPGRHWRVICGRARDVRQMSWLTTCPSDSCFSLIQLHRLRHNNHSLRKSSHLPLQIQNRYKMVSGLLIARVVPANRGELLQLA